jgi:hypothetical protein
MFKSDAGTEAGHGCPIILTKVESLRKRRKCTSQMLNCFLLRHKLANDIDIDAFALRHDHFRLFTNLSHIGGLAFTPLFCSCKCRHRHCLPSLGPHRFTQSTFISHNRRLACRDLQRDIAHSIKQGRFYQFTFFTILSSNGYWPQHLFGFFPGNAPGSKSKSRSKRKSKSKSKAKLMFDRANGLVIQD